MARCTGQVPLAARTTAAEGCFGPDIGARPGVVPGRTDQGSDRHAVTTRPSTTFTGILVSGAGAGPPVTCPFPS